MSEQRPEDWWPFRVPSSSADAPSGPAHQVTPARPQYEPTQHEPTQYEPTQYQPTQYQPTQYQPTQYGAPTRPGESPHWVQPGPPYAGPPSSYAGPPSEQQFGAPVQPVAAQWPAPQAWAARPAPHQPRRTGPAAVVLTLFLVVGMVAGAALSGYFDRGASTQPVISTIPTTSTSTSSTGATSTSATASPSSSATARRPPSSTYTPYQVPQKKWKALPVPRPTNNAERTVQANALYGFEMPAATSCPSIPDDIGLKAQFRELSQQLIDCQFEAWQPIFEELDLPLAEPTLVTFRDSVSTECGTVSDEQSFYCPVSAAIYLSEQRFESSQEWWRLHFVNTIVHEFLHHVQATAGILEAAYVLDMRDDERTRRVELQAYCLTSRMMLITPSYEFDGDDYRILKQWTTEGGSDTHGSVASRQHWWLRGFDQQTPAGCNTWVVEADQVT